MMDEQAWEREMRRMERWRQKREARDLERAVANGTAKTCAMWGKMTLARNAKTRYRHVPWHGMQPTDEVLCASCCVEQKEASPLNTPAAKAKAAGRKRAYMERDGGKEAMERLDAARQRLAELDEQWAAGQRARLQRVRVEQDTDDGRWMKEWHGDYFRLIERSHN